MGCVCGTGTAAITRSMTPVTSRGASREEGSVSVMVDGANREGGPVYIGALEVGVNPPFGVPPGISRGPPARVTLQSRRRRERKPP